MADGKETTATDVSLSVQMASAVGELKGVVSQQTVSFTQELRRIDSALIDQRVTTERLHRENLDQIAKAVERIDRVEERVTNALTLHAKENESSFLAAKNEVASVNSKLQKLLWVGGGMSAFGIALFAIVKWLTPIILSLNKQ